MRGAIRLGAVTPIVALGILALTETLLLAQSPKNGSPKSPPAVEPIELNRLIFGADVPSKSLVGAEVAYVLFLSEPVPDGNPIRQRFVELSKKKAYALNEEQLKREVEVLEREVKELEAWAKTDEAVRMLHEVVQKHPNTKAAEAASGAIRLIEQQRARATVESDPRRQELHEVLERSHEGGNF
jgi:ribosomal protein L31E